jgi:hypothetical protein
MPHRFANHLVLVSSNVGGRPLIDEIEHQRNIELASRLGLILRDQAADVLCKGDTKLGGFGMSPPLRIRIQGDLSSRIHDGTIMPSDRNEGKLKRPVPAPACTSGASKA